MVKHATKSQRRHLLKNGGSTCVLHSTIRNNLEINQLMNSFLIFD
jgi:hypothetical protein